MKDYLIIKKNTDTFEKKINSWLETVADIIDDKEVSGHQNGYKKLILIYKNLKNILNCENRKIIIFDELSLYLISLLFTRHSYLWLWNTVPTNNSSIVRLKIAQRTNRVFTFDESDCRKYGLRLNSQFFYRDRDKKTELEYDLYFVGLDKGRYATVSKLYHFLKNNGLCPRFDMLRDPTKNYKNDEFLRSNLIEYDTVLDNINRSKAVLDLCKDGQSGLTYRAMEAIFYDKKIVTNNENYIKYPFYSPKSIYILQNNKYEGLTEFINGPEIKYDEAIKNYYSVENWIGRFK